MKHAAEIELERQREAWARERAALVDCIRKLDAKVQDQAAQLRAAKAREQ